MSIKLGETTEKPTQTAVILDKSYVNNPPDATPKIKADLTSSLLLINRYRDMKNDAGE